MSDNEAHYDIKWTIPKGNLRGALLFCVKVIAAAILINIPLVFMIYSIPAGIFAFVLLSIIALRFTHTKLRAYFKRQIELHRLYRLWKL